MVLPQNRAATLADVALETPWLEVDCRKCGRAGRLRVDRLISQHGGDSTVWSVVEMLASDCPRRNETQTYEICGVRCPTLAVYSR